MAQGFKAVSNPPDARDPALPYGDVGPGLYPDETALELDSGELIAVSAEIGWIQNGAVVVKGIARWIEADGRTKRTASGREVEVSYPATIGAHDVATFGVEALAAEVQRMVVGEPAQLTREVLVEEGDPEVRPVIDVPESVRLGISVRAAISAVRQVDQLSGSPIPLA